MPRSELAATALALIAGACLAFPSQAGAEQSSSQSASKPVWDAGDAKPAGTQQPGDHTVTAETLKNAKETDRLMRRLNEAALWTGTDEQIRARSIRFR